jgi:hypothetical protein
MIKKTYNSDQQAYYDNYCIIKVNAFLKRIENFKYEHKYAYKNNLILGSPQLKFSLHLYKLRIIVLNNNVRFSKISIVTPPPFSSPQVLIKINRPLKLPLLIVGYKISNIYR